MNELIDIQGDALLMGKIVYIHSDASLCRDGTCFLGLKKIVVGTTAQNPTKLLFVYLGFIIHISNNNRKNLLAASAPGGGLAHSSRPFHPNVCGRGGGTRLSALKHPPLPLA